MTNTMPMLTDEQREEAIAFIKKCDAVFEKGTVTSTIRQIALAALTAPVIAHINRIESRDSWGPYVEIRAYESELDAFKSKEDFGGHVVEAYGAPPVPALKLPDEMQYPNRFKEGFNLCIDEVKRMNGVTK